ncbi:MAG: Mur ligase family protein, partial [Bacteroidota bacterium]
MQIRGQKFSIIGGARSGIAVAKLLKLHGAEVFLSETAPAEKMQLAIAELNQHNIAHEFGDNTENVLQADVIVLSPGVPSDVPLVKQALVKGLRVVSEIEVASWFCKGPIVGITGTNGKTTTTTLVGRIFEDVKKPSVVAGNIGVAFSEVVERVTEESTAILEISS